MIFIDIRQKTFNLMSNLPVIILFLHIIYYIWEIILQHYKFSIMRIGNLVLYGKVTKEEIGRIKALLPSTDIKINGSRI